jgi:phosphatidylserine/phosphatidylglycerophosphate/cardiolipin synthase-like enzyme
LKTVPFLLIISLLITGCAQKNHTDGEFAPRITIMPAGEFTGTIQPSINPDETVEISSNSLEVFFTDPNDLFPGDYSGGIDELLVGAINAARISVDLAIYNINIWSIRDALINAYQRGIQVRMVMESDNINDDVPAQLKSAGIDIVGDRREGLMHNKFVIVDSEDVWTGSANMTIGSFYYDNNNLVHLHSAMIAEDYTTEFEEMYIRDMFGSDVVAGTPHPQIQMGNNLIEVYFSPDDQVSEHINQLVKNAQQSIYFMAYSFTANNLGDALIERLKAGIIVEGVMDGGQIDSNTGTEFDPFLLAGVKVFRVENEGLMHHKVIIIDRKIVITGSYNFSMSAEKTNDENVIVIHSQQIAEKYLEEFETIISRLPK